MKSTAVDGERFFVKTRFGKWRNTLCISHFSNRRIGGKDPSSAVGDLFRGSPDLVGSTSRNTAGAGTVSVPVCPAINRYAYGAVEPLTGDGYFLVLPYCNTVCMNIFLKQLSEKYADDIILLCCDGAAWHKSAALELPDNIVLFHIPPYTPEMNPIEQIWKEIRKRGFRNEIFATLEKVVDRLCDTICSLNHEIISSITGREWIIKLFN